MAIRTTNLLRNENYANHPTKKKATEIIDVHYIHDAWSMNSLNLKDYGHKSNKAERYILVVIDKFNKV